MHRRAQLEQESCLRESSKCKRVSLAQSFGLAQSQAPVRTETDLGLRPADRLGVEPLEVELGAPGLESGASGVGEVGGIDASSVLGVANTVSLCHVSAVRERRCGAASRYRM